MPDQNDLSFFLSIGFERLKKNKTFANNRSLVSIRLERSHSNELPGSPTQKSNTIIKLKDTLCLITKSYWNDCLMKLPCTLRVNGAMIII